MDNEAWMCDTDEADPQGSSPSGLQEPFCPLFGASHVLVTQSCLILCDPLDCSPPGSSAHGNFQARILSGLPFLPPRDLPVPGIEPASLSSLSLAGGYFTMPPPGKPV